MPGPGKTWRPALAVRHRPARSRRRRRPAVDPRRHAAGRSRLPGAAGRRKRRRSVRVETPLVLAIIRQESAFDVTRDQPGRRAGADAADAGHGARTSPARLGIPYSPSALIGSPEYNVSLGSAYIGSMLQRFDGSYILALAAYNAGPSRVNQWLRQQRRSAHRHRGGGRLDRDDPVHRDPQLRAALPGEPAGLSHPPAARAARADAGGRPACDERDGCTAARRRRARRSPGFAPCVFDAYGTLFDVGAATARCRDALGEHADALSALWRTKQLEYTWLRSLRGDFVDFWHVTGQSLDYAWPALGLDDPALRSRLMELYFVLDAYPEVPETLRALKAAGVRTAILSNGSPSMLIAAVQRAGCDDLLDARSSPSMPPASTSRTPASTSWPSTVCSCRPRRSAFVSSNYWDASGAARFGFRVVWINRTGGRPDRLPGEPSRRDRLAGGAAGPAGRYRRRSRSDAVDVRRRPLLRLRAEVLDRCRDRGLRLATAESCTGGLIAGCLTAIAGSSHVFDRGFVTYSNVAKTAMLGVPPICWRAAAPSTRRWPARWRRARWPRRASRSPSPSPASPDRTAARRQAGRAGPLRRGAQRRRDTARAPRLRGRPPAGAGGDGRGGAAATGAAARLRRRFRRWPPMCRARRRRRRRAARRASRRR